mmetsp:Transcript_41105/g.81126  ORF Transcript_41105/g.81126 Transcript_41105/m.81126 type:complete len:210 (-) Transcript_41105:101-730(-)
MALSRPTVGSRVQIVATGRAGEVILDDPDDASMTYKVQFDDGAAPEVDWFSQGAVSIDSTAIGAEDSQVAQKVEKATKELAALKALAEENARAKAKAEELAARAALKDKADADARAKARAEGFNIKLKGCTGANSPRMGCKSKAHYQLICGCGYTESFDEICGYAMDLPERQVSRCPSCGAEPCQELKDKRYPGPGAKRNICPGAPQIL